MATLPDVDLNDALKEHADKEDKARKDRIEELKARYRETLARIVAEIKNGAQTAAADYQDDIEALEAAIASLEYGTGVSDQVRAAFADLQGQVEHLRTRAIEASTHELESSVAQQQLDSAKAELEAAKATISRLEANVGSTSQSDQQKAEALHEAGRRIEDVQRELDQLKADDEDLEEEIKVGVKAARDFARKFGVPSGLITPASTVADIMALVDAKYEERRKQAADRRTKPSTKTADPSTVSPASTAPASSSTAPAAAAASATSDTGKSSGSPSTAPATDGTPKAGGLDVVSNALDNQNSPSGDTDQPGLFARARSKTRNARHALKGDGDQS